MISKKLAVLTFLTKHIEGTNPDWDPDCPFDLRDSVYRGRTVFGDETKTPFIALLEAPRQIAPNGGGDASLVQSEDWTILIQGFAEEDEEHPTDPAYNLLAWVQKRMARITQQPTSGQTGGLYPDEFRMGDLKIEILYQIPVVRPGKDDVSNTAYFYMPIGIKIVTDLANPFEPLPAAAVAR